MLLLLIPFAVGFSQSVYAQESAEPGIARTDTLHVQTISEWALQAWIIPESVAVTLDGVDWDKTNWSLDYQTGVFTLQAPVVGVVVVSYRYLPLGIKPVYTTLRPPVVNEDSTRLVDIAPATGQTSTVFDPFADSQLERSGSITRGITTGNRQDVTVESGFRMQLSGEIADGINVRALLTDENTPIQPEGTTQRLNEFDRVLIELESSKAKATLGDFTLQFRESTFAVFNRKLQGASAQVRLPESSRGFFAGGTVTAAGATARGLYRNQQIETQEGVQGPYRLVGSNGEPFIIVIAGSEKVYLDGNLLTRGETEEYVIDYASGEIVFTSNRLVSREDRINVEFEYTTNRFTRSLVGAEALLSFGNRNSRKEPTGRLSITVLREVDSNSFSDELGLTAANLEQIEMAGDTAARVSGAVSVPFDPEAPYTQYVRRDTLESNGQTVTFFRPIRSLSESGEVFRVRFTRVEAGQGDYERIGDSVNGIQYAWIGTGKGTYVSERILPQPVSQVVADIGASVNLLPDLEAFGEWAVSVFDRNRLSAIDDEDNRGGVYRAGIRLKPVPVAIGNAGGKIEGVISHQERDALFTSFDRVRPVEFGRDWNISAVGDVETVVSGLSENQTLASIRWTDSNGSFFEGGWGSVQLAKRFSGDRGWAEVVQRSGTGLDFQYKAEFVTSTDSLTRSIPVSGSWFKHQARLTHNRAAGKLQPEIQFRHEDRRLAATVGDSLSGGSLAFFEVKPSVKWSADKVEIGPGFSWRSDRSALDGQMSPEATSLTVSTEFSVKPSSRFRTEGSLGWRQKDYSPSFEQSTGVRDANSLVATWNTRVTLLKRALEVSTFYETLTEKAPVLQEVYREVQDGLGQYVWEDYNADGLRQISEFRPTDITERFLGNYVLLLVPSDKLEPVINVHGRVRISWRPSRWFEGVSTPLARFIREVSGVSVVEVQERSTEQDLSQIYLLRSNALRRAETTINGKFRISQDVEFFRTRTAYGGSVHFLQMRSLNRFSAGVESRFLNRWKAEIRGRVSGSVFLRGTVSYEENSTESENIGGRTRNISQWRGEPTITVNWTTRLVSNTGVTFIQKNEQISGATASTIRFPVEVIWSSPERGQLRASVEYGNTSINGDAVGLVGYELTEGRGSGRSVVWNTGYQVAFNRTMRASVYYDGRAPEGAPVLHTVRAQVTASF